MVAPFKADGRTMWRRWADIFYSGWNHTSRVCMRQLDWLHDLGLVIVLDIFSRSYRPAEDGWRITSLRASSR